MACAGQLNKGPLKEQRPQQLKEAGLHSHWSTGILTESYVSLTLGETLITTMDDCLMQQVVTFPTRGSNILDLCFTTDPDLVQSC